MFRFFSIIVGVVYGLLGIFFAFLFLTSLGGNLLIALFPAIGTVALMAICIGVLRGKRWAYKLGVVLNVLILIVYLLFFIAPLIYANSPTPTEAFVHEFSGFLKTILVVCFLTTPFFLYALTRKIAVIHAWFVLALIIGGIVTWQVMLGRSLAENPIDYGNEAQCQTGGIFW